jgi:hypothetical protein
MSISMDVQDCGKWCKTFFQFLYAKFFTASSSAVLKNVPLCAKRASKFYL